MATTNLKLRTLLVADRFDEAAINDALNHSDTQLLDMEDIVFATDANIVLTDNANLSGESSNLTIRVRDPNTVLTVTRRIQFPTVKRLYVVDNTTAQSIECWIGSGAVVTIPTVDSGVIFSDGTDMLLIKLGRSVGGGPANAGMGNFEVPMTFIGLISENRELVRLPFTRPVVFKSTLPASQGVAGTAPTGTFDFTLRKNGVSIGTASFAAAATTATFSFASNIIFAPGDYLSVDSQATPDATLANVGFMFHGEKL
jgi:hypothetical protein